MAAGIYPVKTETQETGRSLAKHSEAATRIKESNFSSGGVPGHHTSREETEGPGTATGGEEEEQRQGVGTRRETVEINEDEVEGNREVRGGESEENIEEEEREG